MSKLRWPDAAQVEILTSRGRETQVCCHFWTGIGSLCLTSVSSGRDPGGCGHKTRNCRQLLDSCLVCVSQNCQQSQGKSQESTVARMGKVLLAKSRIVVAFGVAFGESQEKREEERGKNGEERKEER